MLTPLDEYKSRQRQYLTFRCKTCGTVQEKTLQAFERGSLCITCHPVGHSQWELEMFDWVKSIVPDAISGDRKVIAPKEIDIWCPMQRVGIECHGLYHHSVEIDDDKNLHAQKAKLAAAAGVTLLQVFWDEWRDKQEIVKSMIRHRLHLVERRVGARSCKIREVSSAEQRRFFDDTHIAGYVPSKVAWGLYHNDELVACLSARKPRQKTWGNRLEVARFSSLRGTLVTGALSRLSKAATSYAKASGYLGLMTYVDARVGLGDGYGKAGFRHVGVTGADYWYSDGHVRYDRFKFRARDGKTERQVATEGRVRKIWGAGNAVLTLE